MSVSTRSWRVGLASKWASREMVSLVARWGIDIEDQAGRLAWLGLAVAGYTLVYCALV